MNRVCIGIMESILDYCNLDFVFGYFVFYIEILSVYYFGIEYLGYKKLLI